VAKNERKMLRLSIHKSWEKSYKKLCIEWNADQRGRAYKIVMQMFVGESKKHKTTEYPRSYRKIVDGMFPDEKAFEDIPEDNIEILYQGETSIRG